MVNEADQAHQTHTHDGERDEAMNTSTISMLNVKKNKKQKENWDGVTRRKRVFERKGASHAKQKGVFRATECQENKFHAAKIT